MTDVYKKLAKHLDRLPGGFPETESGVELKILNKLFTKKQAHIATAMTMLPEPADVIAERLNTEPDLLAPPSMICPKMD